MNTKKDKAGELPDFSAKVVSVCIQGNDHGVCLAHPRWETQGGHLFLVGKVPVGSSANDWSAGIPGAVAWDKITDYLVFDSVDHYLERLAIFRRKKRKT